ncbi:1-propanol dehydrogenase PduQ [uncultured Cetobacterium sp.]|uniref:1-propanol dehydrogenase PduQ n=1 Tax=uncultured Cetobacterium sp. TaxID=527638 RepID=UPI00261686B6|nr:1-propanol dehydrogenase PduQ [uncultured Cetobacterium sp.]
MNEFFIKPKIKFGIDSLDYLESLTSKKYFIVTDDSMVKLKIIDKILEKLPKNSEIDIFSEVIPNPTVETIENGLKKLIKFNPECVIALGGGSPIDACKGMLYFEKKVAEECSEKIKPFRHFIAIPTTSGTGSEVTSYSVISSGENKIALANEDMLPDIAILNPEFMKTLPPKIIADTGMDVLTHSLEAYISLKSNPFTSAMAIEAIKLIESNLLKHYKNPQELYHREKVQDASCLAGVAFNNSSLGINHSVAHTIGAKFHISHGRANAIVMPYIIQVNKNAWKEYAKISKELGYEFSTVVEGKDAFVKLVEELKKEMQIETSLSQVGVEFNEFKSKIPILIKDIKKDICTEYNPETLSDEEYVKLLLKIYFGNNDI